MVDGAKFNSGSHYYKVDFNKYFFNLVASKNKHAVTTVGLQKSGLWRMVYPPIKFCFEESHYIEII